MIYRWWWRWETAILAQNQSKSKDEWPGRQRLIHKVTSAIRSVLCASEDNSDEERDNLKKNNRLYGRFYISVFQKANYTIYAIYQCIVLDWSPRCTDNNNNDCVNDDYHISSPLIVMMISFGLVPPWSMMQGSLFHAVLRLLTFADRELDFYDENRHDNDGDG